MHVLLFAAADGLSIHPTNHSSVHPPTTLCTAPPPCNFNRNLAQVLIEFIRRASNGALLYNNQSRMGIIGG